MRTLRIGLVVSILLNIFLLAAVLGGVAWLRAGQPMIGPGALRVAGAELPREERRAFRLALRDTRRSLRPQAIAARKARDEAAALLRQPTLDQAALNGALARARDADATMRSALEGRAVSFIATLPQADRKRLADGMVRRAEQRRDGMARRAR